MKKLKLILMGFLGICLMSGCAKDMQITQPEDEEIAKQVEESYISKEGEEQGKEVLQVTQEMRRQQLDELMTFIESNQEVTLKLVNLLEGNELQTIETANSRAFNPEWIEPYIFTYNNPYLGIDEIEKVTYAFNQSYELLPTITEPIVYETDKLYMEKYEDILDFL